MKDCVPNSLSQGSLCTHDTFYRLSYKQRRDKRKCFFSGDASCQCIPLVGGGSGFLNSCSLGVIRGTFSSGTALSGTSGALKILVNYHFVKHNVNIYIQHLKVQQLKTIRHKKERITY